MLSAGERELLPRHCELCPRRCGANRQDGQVGACGADDRLVLARAALHEWEEPPISVGAGSGTVFFSNCPLRCVYCQNAQIARGAHGTAVRPSRLTGIYHELREIGAANVNLVTPTHYLPFVVRSIRDVREDGFDLPFICNTSGYETVQAVQTMDGLVDVYLTDFKYWRGEESDAAARYSHAPDYFEVARSALSAMVQSVGTPQFDWWRVSGVKEDEALSRTASVGTHDASVPDDSEERLMKGVIVRHLMLPGRLEDSKRIMANLWAEYGDDVLYSVMSQYTPMGAFPQAPELNARVSKEDYERLLDYLDRLGMTEYYWQEGGAAEQSFIPAFDSSGV
ncbi:MAG: radical SAM protein [Eggerthellaceae bacterium]|nr:radical SAM protein [Eggerthellaceae bacterium]